MIGKILIILLSLQLINYSLKKWETLAYRNLNVERKVAKNRGFPEEELQMIVETTNKKLLPLTWIELEATVPEELTIRGEYITAEKDGASTAYKHYTIFSLLWFQRIRRKLTISFSKRGHYIFRDVKVKTSDYFGFKNYEKSYDNKVEVLIYPKLYPIDQLLVDSTSYLGDTTVKRWIIDDPTYFSGTRGYTYREPLKKIHWKATSRTGTIQVKDHQYTADLSIIFVVNIPHSKYLIYLENEELMESLLEVAATYIDLAKRNGISYGLATNSLIEGEEIKGIIIPPNLDDRHFIRLFDMLAKIKLASTVPIEKIIDEITFRYSNTNVVSLISPEISEGMILSLSKAKRKGFSFEITTSADAMENYPEIHHLAKVNLIQGGGLADVAENI